MAARSRRDLLMDARTALITADRLRFEDEDEAHAGILFAEAQAKALVVIASVLLESAISNGLLLEDG